jgi:type IV secretory pathway TrbF-like protein
MTNLALRLQESKLTLEKGNKTIDECRNIIAKLSGPKKLYRPFVYDDRGEQFAIGYTDQFDNEYELYIPTKKITDFVDSFYSDVTDECRGGEHYQSVDQRSAYDYLCDNAQEVLTDFLNNTKL